MNGGHCRHLSVHRPGLTASAPLHDGAVGIKVQNIFNLFSEKWILTTRVCHVRRRRVLVGIIENSLGAHEWKM